MSSVAAAQQQGAGEHAVSPRTIEESDEQLVERCRHGSEDAFAQLVRRHEGALQRHCAPIVGQSAANDATQDAFLSAWRAIRAGSEIRALRPWLFTIAHRKALALLRERRRTPVDALPDSLTDGVSSAEQAQRAEQVRETLTVLAALPEAQREAFLGVAVQGMSGRQIAGRLGVSELTARQLVFRARATLRSGAAVCLTPPLALVRLLRKLLGTGRAGAAMRDAAAWQQAAVTAKVAGVAILGATAIGVGAIGATPGAGTGHRAHTPAASHGTVAALAKAALGAARDRGLAALGGSHHSFHGAGSHAVIATRFVRPATSSRSAAAIAGPSAGTSPDGRAGSGSGASAASVAQDASGGSVAVKAAAVPAVAHGVAGVAGVSAVTVRTTVGAGGDAAPSTVTNTLGVAHKAVSSITGVVSGAVVPLAAVAQDAVGAVAAAPSTTVGGGAESAAGAVQNVVAAGTDTVADGTGGVGSNTTQTAGTVTGAPTATAGQVAQGATGAVSAIGHLLGR